MHEIIKHIDEVAEETYRLETRVPGVPEIFTVYFIKEGGGVLIEPGPAALVPTIQAVIKDLGLTGLEYIIPTHIHLDHGGALGELAQLFPQAKVVVNPQGARHAIDPSQLIRSTKMAFGDEFAAIYGAILPVPESQVKIVQDEERLSVDGRQLLLIHTPGHAPHHIAIFDTKSKGLFCGEALGLIYRADSPPLPAAAPPGFDLEVCLKDMERLRDLQPRLLFYSHGGLGYEPEGLISSAIENTKIIGDVILRALNTGEMEETIVRNVGNYIWNHFSTRLYEHELRIITGGYIHYFKKKGLV